MLFAVNCGPPRNPTNGDADIPEHTREGARVMYRCNDGFRPSADFPSTCESTALWDPPPQDHNCTFVEGTYDLTSNFHGYIFCTLNHMHAQLMLTWFYFHEMFLVLISSAQGT